MSEAIILSDSEISLDETSSSSESEIEEVIPVKASKNKPTPKKISQKSLGEIEESNEPPPPARRKYAPRKPLSEEAKENRRNALIKARAVASANASQRRILKLKKELGHYNIVEEEDSSDSEDEIVLQKRKKQVVLPTKRDEKISQVETHVIPKKKKEKPVLTVPGPETLKKEKTTKELKERMKQLEIMILEQKKEKKEDRKKTININIGKEENEKVLEVKKMLLDLGL